MSEIRVRIAPSPTGSPHVGTAYMGLFNYAFAKSQHGKFILRIEDTDQTRSRPEYEQGIFNALKWIGLSWDEGPDVGGPHAPYRQSERTAIYQQHAQMLLDSNAAYRCFCTEERLSEMREKMRAEKISGGYDGFCRNLTEDQIHANLKDGKLYVVRLKVPDSGDCKIHDRLRGEVIYDLTLIDDQILLKSDSFPTYHLANVVDDHLMGITHVIRGEEWLPSTPKHVLLYQAFGWTPPEFIHLPLLLNPDGSKLSKRKNPTSILYYRDAGYIPEALLNYLGLMSYSRPNQEEKFDLADFVSDFDIQRMSLGGSIFDLKKLTWLNSRYIRESFTPETLWLRLKQWRFNDETFIEGLRMMQNRMETLGDLFPKFSYIFFKDVDYDPEMLVPKDRTLTDAAQVIQTMLYELDGIRDWIPAEIEKRTRDVAEFWQWPIRDITAVMFVALMGNKVGPPLYESMILLGSDVSRRRLMLARDKAGGIGKKKEAELEKRWANRIEKQE